MRRSKATALKPATVITSIVICAAACLAGIGYVWAKTQVWGLSREIKKMELRLDQLKRNNDVLQRNYAAMCDPARLNERVRDLKLGLVSPHPSQIVRMPSVEPLVQRQIEQQFDVATNKD